MHFEIHTEEIVAQDNEQTIYQELRFDELKINTFLLVIIIGGGGVIRSHLRDRII